MMFAGLLLWAGTLAGIAYWWGIYGQWSVTPAGGYVYPATTNRFSLMQGLSFPNHDPDWWIRNVYTAGHNGFHPIPRDRTLEIAVVDDYVTGNLTPWAESSITGADLAPGGMTDVQFIKTALADLDRTVGPDWAELPQVSPMPLNIAWRVKNSYVLAGKGLFVNFNPRAESLFSCGWLDASEPSKEPMIWLKPAISRWGDHVRIRLGDPAAGGRLYTVETKPWVLWALGGSLVACVGVPWLLTPPIWRHWVRRRRHRHRLCIGCGYPTPVAVPSACEAESHVESTQGEPHTLRDA